MKITIAYTRDEEGRAEELAGAALRQCPGSRVRRSARHAPYLHIYITQLPAGCGIGKVR